MVGGLIQILFALVHNLLLAIDLSQFALGVRQTSLSGSHLTDFAGVGHFELVATDSYTLFWVLGPPLVHEKMIIILILLTRPTAFTASQFTQLALISSLIG